MGAVSISGCVATYRIAGELRGYMSWKTEPRLYIDWLWSGTSRALAPVFAAFRKKYPNTVVYFHAAEDNDRMQRFIKLVGARKDPTGCYFVRI